MNATNHLRLNVGFIIHETIGYIREFPLDLPFIHLPPDLDIEQFSGVVRITRAQQGLVVQVQVQGETTAQCGRCLVDFSQQVSANFTDLYAFTPKLAAESGLVLPENGQLDLEPSIREELLLSLPINPLCRPDCKGLCPVCGDNRNEVQCEHSAEVIDPRLEILKSMISKPKGE
ncbi:MAG TPA: DUF177 domain-containing protein [Anaerolineales bacterium]|nr:DUF177 domain-containing protein [Anaerolineales bacterium]